MSAVMTAFDRVTLKRFALGIRFNNQFGLEDALGTVIDDVLGSGTFGPERFENTVTGAGMRQLLNKNETEKLTFSRSDTIYEMTREIAIDELPGLTEDFVGIAWKAVCDRAPKAPAINRYGALISFPLPDDWNPIRSILDVDPAVTSEFDLRYTRRLPAEEGLALRDISDFRHAIFIIQTRNAQTTAVIDYQYIFSPALDSDKARRDHPFARFVEKALAYYRTSGWDFIRNRIERLPRAA